MFSTVSTPVLLILAAVIGLLVGLLVSSLFSREPKSTGENPIPEKYVKDGYAESARLLYSPATKKVITFLDEDYYEEFITLTPEQKKRVLRLISNWNEWGGVTPKVPEQQTATPSASSPFESPASTAKIPPLPLVPNPLAPIEKPETLEDLGINVPVPVEPVPAVVRFNLGGPVKIPEKPKTFVDQINEKLEAIMAGTPDEKRGIHLEDNGHQGVIVWIGLNHYDGVDAVPFPDVQKLIKQAVARWESEA